MALIVGGTAVDATAAELNIMDGVTSTAAELNELDGFSGDLTGAFTLGSNSQFKEIFREDITVPSGTTADSSGTISPVYTDAPVYQFFLNGRQLAGTAQEHYRIGYLQFYPVYDGAWGLSVRALSIASDGISDVDVEPSGFQTSGTSRQMRMTSAGGHTRDYKLTLYRVA